MNSIRIGSKEIGTGRTYIIAEAGSNHNGDLEIARELIRQAADAGVDAVKFQTFRARDHYSKYTPAFTYLEKSGETRSTYDLIAALEIDRTWHPQLMRACAESGVTFLSSPCDREAVQDLAKLGMEAFKLASFDLPDTPFIEDMARVGKPMILSTGMADYKDIANAAAACRRAGNERIIFLQCVSLYPAPPELANLNAIRTIQEAFGFPVGYSDHTMGDHVAIASVALGAVMIEKHFTLDRTMKGPDHPFAIEPHELKEMVRKIREVELARGNGMKTGPHEREVEMFEKGRRSVHARIDIPAGTVLRAEHLCVKRPGFGVAPDLMDRILGMKVTRDVPADYWITWEAFR